mgnify:FL=1
MNSLDKGSGCMANNVYSTITLHTKNHEVESKFIESFEFLEDMGETSLEYMDIFNTNIEIADGDFFDEFIGPRVAHVTGHMGTEVEIESAWMSPNKFFEILCEEMSRIDEDVTLTMKYEDEYYNFAGVYIWSFGELEQREESGGWFKEQQDSLGRDPSDFQEFVTEQLEEWESEWLTKLC